MLGMKVKTIHRPELLAGLSLPVDLYGGMIESPWQELKANKKGCTSTFKFFRNSVRKRSSCVRSDIEIWASGHLPQVKDPVLSIMLHVPVIVFVSTGAKLLLFSGVLLFSRQAFNCVGRNYYVLCFWSL